MSIGNSNIVMTGQDRQILNWRLDTDPYPGVCAFNAFDTAITTAYIDYKILIPEDATPQEIAALDLGNIFLNVTWGVGVAGQPCGTATESAQVDLLRGMWVSVPASSIAVGVSYPAKPFPAFQPPIEVNVMVGKGSKAPAGMTGVPRKSFETGMIATTQTSDPIPIPKFAVSVLVESTSPIVAGDVTLTQVTGNQVLGQSNMVGDKVVDQLPIVNGAQSITLKNNSNSTKQFRAIFYLAL